MKKLVADQSKCVGGGNCVMLAPQLFTQGEDDGLVQIIRSVVDQEDMETALLAIDSCPGQALTIVEVDE